MEIIYFVAGRTQQQLKLPGFVDTIGLGHAFDGKPPVVRGLENGKGIDGQSGSIIGRSAGIGYYPERQDWQPLVGAENVWIGITRDSLPTPREMVQRGSKRSMARATNRPATPLAAKNQVVASDAWPTGKPRSRVSASSSTDWL